MSEKTKEALLILVNDYGKAMGFAGMAHAEHAHRDHWLAIAAATLDQITAIVEAS